jgi:hypothetical protein
MRSGHIWAMVASQKGAMEEHVKPSNPARYEQLTIDGPPARVSPPNVSEDPELLKAFWVDMLERNRACSNILAQAGMAIRSGAGPFEGTHHVFLAGHSQTGFVVTNYLREAHHALRGPDGASVYDGYFPAGFPSTPFQNVGTPLVQMMSDGDVSNPERSFSIDFSNRAYRRDDSDDAGDPFRLYELAGVPHMGIRYPPYNSTELWVEQAKPLVRPDMHMNSLPHNELFNVGLDHLIQWAVNATTPPKAERIVTSSDGFFAKDEHGNTAGGVRCVQMDVPRKHYFANVPMADGKPASGSVGTEVPFTAEEFAATYRDEADYRSQFESRLAELVADGWLLADDADYMLLDLEPLEVG